MFRRRPFYILVPSGFSLHLARGRQYIYRGFEALVGWVSESLIKLFNRHGRCFLQRFSSAFYIAPVCLIKMRIERVWVARRIKFHLDMSVQGTYFDNILHIKFIDISFILRPNTLIGVKDCNINFNGAPSMGIPRGVDCHRLRHTLLRQEVMEGIIFCAFYER